MDELKTCCHINMSPRGDGWGPRIWRGGQPPRSTAQRSKGEHEMPISYDSPDAHAFWHRVHLAMFTGLPVAFKDAIALVFILFLTFFLPSVPSCWSIYTSYFRSLFLSRFFFVGLFFWSDSFLTFLLIQWICVFPSHPSFYRLYPFVLFLLCILSSFSVRHKNNRLFPTAAFFLSDFIAHILLWN